jgi:hypothetical protein
VVTMHVYEKLNRMQNDALMKGEQD